MFGYITSEKAELKMKEFELYNGYYCGVCKSISKRWGQIPRMVLTYDAAFLAMVMATAMGCENAITIEHCIMHPVKKKTVVQNEAVDRAADIMMILAWYKLKDDARDDNSTISRLAMSVMKGKYRALCDMYPELTSEIGERIETLSELESAGCESLDEAAEAFSKIMETILVRGSDADEKQQVVLRKLGYHLGKWVYVIDAYDDLYKDITKGAYNPLVQRYGYDPKSEGKEEFRERIRESVETNLLIYLAEMGKAVDLLDKSDNIGIIDNIVYMGLLRRMEKVLAGEEKENGE